MAILIHWLALQIVHEGASRCTTIQMVDQQMNAWTIFVVPHNHTHMVHSLKQWPVRHAKIQSVMHWRRRRGRWSPFLLFRNKRKMPKLTWGVDHILPAEATCHFVVLSINLKAVVRVYRYYNLLWSTNMHPGAHDLSCTQPTSSRRLSGHPSMYSTTVDIKWR